MIKELKINNLAIIKDLKIQLDTNFSALTGETGAGKSIILDGISLILGSRANTLAIRKNATTLKVEAVFSLDDKSVDRIKNQLDLDIIDNELIVYREVSIDGKTKITINDKRITLASLKSIMEHLVDIVGQNENQYLLNSSYHMKLLDAFLDNKYNLKNVVSEIKTIEKEIINLEEEKKQVLEKKDFYEFSVNEIENLELYPNIDVELEKEYKLIFNSGRIKEAFSNMIFELDENVVKGVKSCIKTINSISDISKNIDDIKERLEEVKTNISEIYNDLTYMDIDEKSFDELDKLSERLNSINKIKNKYKDSIGNILAKKEEYITKLESLNYSDTKLENLKNLKEEKIEEYFKLAKKLSDDRKEISKKIEKEINKELQDLNMKDASFKVKIDSKKEIRENGIDEVEFLIRTNKGQDYNKLSKIASGGEISRVMLALKVVFSRVDELRTLIFDEIDAGISGETVKLVAKKLKRLSDDIQVICVTHSASIAMYAKEQFLIEKNALNDSTETQIRKLNEKERIEEIARIISGENVTKDLINHIKNEMKKGRNE